MANHTKEIVRLPGGLMRIDGKYIARDGFNLVAAIRLMDDGKPITVSEFAKVFGLGNSKLGRRKAKRWIHRLAKHQYATPNPIIGTHETMPDGTPITNGRLLEIQMYTANGSVEERGALAALRNRKEYLGKRLLGQAAEVEALEQKEPQEIAQLPANGG
jgi:hypothetical protein